MELEDYIEECAKVFLDEQSRLFDKPVVSNIEEAKEFLEDNFAQVFDNIDDVKEYLDELGMDVEGMSDEEIEEQLEVFCLKDGKYLVLEA